MAMKWNFPANSDGQIRGWSEAGIQTFTGNKTAALAREVCQNSLDAALSEQHPVSVFFTRRKIKSKNIPGYEEFKKILTDCKNYWKDNPTAKLYLDRALEEINSESTFVILASDFFTTGLSNPYDPTSLTGWNTLTKIDGGANKTGDSAGSFGIGKNAPFANSYYRLVFYRTLNTKGEQAAQGIARLASFKDNGGNVSTGVGYFGNPDRNQPVKSIPELDCLWERKHQKDLVGTDIFIFGFNGKETWKDDIYVELIENFLMSVYLEKLAVKVQNEDFLTRKTLGEFIQKYKDSLKNANSYYKVLTVKEIEQHKFEKIFHGLGTLKLQVVVDEKENLNRRVLVVRKSGMKIFDMDRISRSISFSGILTLEGFKLNEFFRQMETPAHDKWEPNRHPDDALAKKYLQELKDWVRESVRSLGEQVGEVETDVKGLGSMLQFNSVAVNSVHQNKPVEKIASQVTAKIVSTESVEETLSKILTEKGSGDSSSETVNGIIQDGEENPAIRTLKGLKKRKSRAIHTGIEDSEGEDIVNKPTGKFIDCKHRIIKTGEKNYRLVVTPPKNVSSGTIRIFAVGEDENSDVEEIKILNFQYLQSGIKTIFNFEIKDGGKYSYSLRAYIYENNN